VNKITLIGNLTKDPEISETPNGIAVCKFSIAVSRNYTNADGEKETDFFNITVWRGRAEVCGKYLKKGNKVAISGSVQFRNYEDKNGVKRQAVDVIAEEVEFLTPRTQSDRTEEPERERPTQERLQPLDDNQLPF
jgi:single-strand DNA-binding protein